jgi:hypothetical protein
MPPPITMTSNHSLSSFVWQWVDVDDEVVLLLLLLLLHDGDDIIGCDESGEDALLMLLSLPSLFILPLTLDDATCNDDNDDSDDTDG